jgi:hypothetical protein
MELVSYHHYPSISFWTQASFVALKQSLRNASVSYRGINFEIISANLKDRLSMAVLKKLSGGSNGRRCP